MLPKLKSLRHFRMAKPTPNGGYTVHGAVVPRVTRTSFQPHRVRRKTNLFGYQNYKVPTSARRFHVPKAATGTSLKTQEKLDLGDFDLSVAAALGGCAFHAYNSPVEDENHWKLDVDDVEVVYYDRDMLEDTFSEVLDLQVLGAELGRKKKTYVRVTLGRNSVQSKTCKDSMTPKWQQTFTMPVRPKEKRIKGKGDDIVKIDVMAEGWFGLKEKLGSVMLSEEDWNSSEAERKFELNTKASGEILQLSAKTLPFSGRDDVQLRYTDCPKANNMLQKWAKLGGKQQRRYCPIWFIHDKKADTEAWMCANKKDKELVVAFRGTTAQKRRDRLTDYRFLTEDLSIGDPKYVKELGPAAVHKGFQKAYKAVGQRVYRAVEAVVGNDASWKVYVTGHSLGGALATLCAFDLASREDFLPEVQMYNFGSPRVGNCFFADGYDKKVPKSWRIANARDMVTTMPKSDVYQHVNTGIKIGKGTDLNTYEVRDGSEGGLLAWLRLGGILVDLAEYGRQLFSGGVSSHAEEEYFAKFKTCASKFKGQ